jgi:hypothetical protein
MKKIFVVDMMKLLITFFTTPFTIHSVDQLLMWVMTNKYMIVILQVVASMSYLTNYGQKKVHK